MLLSMTGFGEARCEQEGWNVAVELRAVNSRYFKLNFRATEGFAGLEPRVEPLLRDHIRRGTLHVNVRIEQTARSDSYRINPSVLQRYWNELASLSQQWPEADPPTLDALLPLPGVVEESQIRTQALDQAWQAVEPAIVQAVSSLNAMREQEGTALKRDLIELAGAIGQRLNAIEHRAPHVLGDYQRRLLDRVNQMLAELDITLQPADVVREVSLFCDRCDISEEIVRMRSHLDQFRATLDLAESTGRKLEFIVQEMGRETNTIGSKANDTQIAREVVELKTALERIREQVQNVE